MHPFERHLRQELKMLWLQPEDGRLQCLVENLQKPDNSALWNWYVKAELPSRIE